MSIVQKWHLKTPLLRLAQEAPYRPLQTGLSGRFLSTLWLSVTASKGPSVQACLQRPLISSSGLFSRHRLSNQKAGVDVKMDWGKQWGGQQSFAGQAFGRRFQERAPEETPPSQWYKLGDDCLLALHRGDITKWFVDTKKDAIVNAANERMLGGGGVDGAIHQAAGRDLYHACKAVPEVERGVRCPTGEARITPGFRLPAQAVIHTVGPVYNGEARSAPLLAAAYRSSINVAADHKLHYVAFPAISCGVYGYPYDEGAEVALSICKEEAAKMKEIHFVLFERPAWTAWLDAARRLELPTVEVDETARKAAQKAALEEKETAAQNARQKAREAAGEREASPGGATSEGAQKSLEGLGERTGAKESREAEAGSEAGAVSKGPVKSKPGPKTDVEMRSAGSREDEGKAPGEATGWVTAEPESRREAEVNVEPFLASTAVGTEAVFESAADEGGDPMKKGFSSCGSFATGQEDAFDDGVEEGTDGNLLKRVRSDDDFEDAVQDEGWEVVPDRSNKKTGDGPGDKVDGGSAK